MTLAENLSDPDFEQALWDVYGQQDIARQATQSRVSVGDVRRAAEMVRQNPHLSPGAVISMTFTGADGPTIEAVSAAEVGRLEDDPLWKRMWFDHAYPKLKAGVRGAITGIYSGWYEGVDRPIRSIAKASDVASADEGGFFLGQMLGALPEAHEALGPSPAARAINERLAGQPVNLGSGFFPGGDIAETAPEQQQLGQPLGQAHEQQLQDVRFSSTGQSVSMGDIGASSVWLLADQIGQGDVVEPGTRAYDFTKMVTGISWEMLTDPTLALDKPVRAALAARKQFSGVSASKAAAEEMRLFGMIDGPRRTVLPEVEIDNWLQSRRGQDAVDWLTRNKDFEDARQLIGGDAEAAHALTKAEDADEVRDIIRHFAGRGINEKFTSPLSHRIYRRIEDTRLARYWEAAADLAPDGGNRYTRMGSWTPGDGIPLSNPTVAAEQFNRWFRNWKAPKEMASKFEERMVGAILEGDRHKAWGVWGEALDELGSDLVAKGHDEGVVRSLTRQMGGPDFGTGTNQRIYWMEQLTEVPETVRPGTRVETLEDGSQWLAHMTPHDAAELMDEAIPFMNVQETRRATSTLSRIVKAPGVVDDDATFWRKLTSDLGEVLGGLGLEDQPKGMIWSVHDGLWAAQRSVWMPLALVTRIAWPMRVVGEEQLRMGAVGLDSMLTHPISYWAWAIGTPKSKAGKLVQAASEAVGVKPRGAVDVLGNPIGQAKEFSDALVQYSRPKAYHGSRPRPGAVGWDRLDAHQAMQAGLKPRVNAGFRIEMGKMWKNDVAQQVADSILRGDNSLDDVFDWFHGSRLHEGMMATSDDFAQRLATPDGVREFLHSEAKRIRQMTGGDQELIESIATRELRGNPVFDVRINKKAINGVINEKVTQLHNDGKLPRMLVVPQDIAQGTQPGAWDRGTSWLFYGLGAVPSNTLSRSPAFKQLYWRSMLDKIPHADNATQEAIWRAGKQANMDKEWLRRAAQRMKETRQARGAADVDNIIQSLDEADVLAKQDGLRGSHALLYSLSEKGQTAEAMRLVFPFAEAWKEIGLTWAKILARSPLHLRRAQIVIEGAQDSGFFYKDPTTGEESYTSPGGGLFGAVAGLPDRVRANLSTPLASLNLFAGSVVPGLGPAAQMATGLVIPDSPEWDDIREILLPFGTTVETAADIFDPRTYVETALPAWMNKALTAIVGEGFDERMWRSHVVDGTRALAATGEYDTSTDEGIRQLEADAEALARKTLWFRAVGQMALPAGFRVDFQVQADSPQAQAEMEKVLGKNFEFGRTDGNAFSMAVLTSLFHTLRTEADGDTYEATRTFLEMFGSNPDNYDLQKWVAMVGQGKTKSLTERADTERGRNWEKRNQELIEALPAVVGYFAPEGMAPSELDIEAFLTAVEKGEKHPLTGEQFIIMSQKLLGSAIYRNAMEQTEGDNSEQARAFKARRRDWLDKNLPHWRWDDPVVGVPEGPNMDQRIGQLEQAISFQAVVDTSAGQGLVKYLTKREQAIEAVMRLDDVETREQAIQAIRSRNSTEQIRSRLREYGKQFVIEHGDFAPMWTEVLSREVEGDEEEAG